MKMFEKFTDRSRKLMALANQEAQRRNTEYIGTEHLLLSMLNPAGDGIAGRILAELGISLGQARLRADLIAPKAKTEMVLTKPYQNADLKLAIEYALDEAKLMSNNYVGTEHLLLGLVRNRECIAYKILTSLPLIGNFQDGTNILLDKDLHRVIKDKVKEFLAGSEQPNGQQKWIITTAGNNVSVEDAANVSDIFPKLFSAMHEMHVKYGPAEAKALIEKLLTVMQEMYKPTQCDIQPDLNA